VALKYQYLKKISGKIYHPDSIKGILESLDFTVVREGLDAMALQVPYHKPDVRLPADVVEEILRIDGLDNIEIPSCITISPSVEESERAEQLKEKISGILTGLGFSEILTNSLTNGAYIPEEEKAATVKLLNNLSNELNVMRPSMLFTALEVLSFNINRKNSDLKLFEFGKTYSQEKKGSFKEVNHLSVYITGQINPGHWKRKAVPADIYYVKGVAETLLKAMGVNDQKFDPAENNELAGGFCLMINGANLVTVGTVRSKLSSRFDIKQPVFFIDFNWDSILKFSDNKITFRPLPKFPAVERDLAIVVPVAMSYHQVELQLNKLHLDKLTQVRLFDVFESDKLGAGKKSMAVNFTFLDEEKTLTDKEIDSWMNRIMTTLEKELGAEIRK
jgi:phenylalanyl-tRNA synthetase beta chain